MPAGAALRTAPGTESPAPPLLAIALLSGAMLGLEVLLLRLFSIIQWHHFAYMIISLALLGYGVSGTFLAVAGRWMQRWFVPLFATNAALFGLTSVGSFLAAQHFTFNPLELLWDPAQPLRLSVTYVLFAVPFFFGANAVGLSFYRFGGRESRIYGADLLGAGTGALAVLVVLFVLAPPAALKIAGALGLAAAGLALMQGSPRTRRWAALPFAAAVAFPALLPEAWTELRLSPYKGLSQALQVAGARVVDRRSSPLGEVTVLENRRIPFRYAPGLSLASPAEPPEQLAIFVDGGEAGVINRYDGAPQSVAYVDYLTSALPYHLTAEPRVLVLGVGGGTHVLQAVYHGAASIDAVELNPQIVDLVRRDFAAFAGDLYGRADVRVHVAEARSFVARGSGSYDVIQVPLLDAFGASAAGLQALNESYLYTVEALGALIGRLAPGGLLAITRWVDLPPRDGPKLFATAVSALEGMGAEDPGARLAWIRGWKTHTLVVKNGAFSPDDAARLAAFAEERSFDVNWVTGMALGQANRFNILDHPYFHEAAVALLGAQAGDYIARYKYAIAPATDDRPFFHNTFRWRLARELLALRGRGGLGLLGWGYPVLAATLAQAAALTLLLVPLPLLFRGRSGAPPGAVRKLRVLAYFAALGFAFLFIEMVFIQKFVLFLGHPTYAAAGVLATFLVFAGLGALSSSRFHRRANPMLIPLAGIAALGLLYVWVLPPFLDAAAPLPALPRAALALLLIAPLGFWMGMPFPLGLARLGAAAPGLIPWAWAINGCASVLSAVLATMLAIHIGFTAVILLGVGLYGLAALSFP